MQSVKVDRDKLIDALTVNRARHAEDVKTAREAYLVDIQRALLAALDLVYAGQVDGIHQLISVLRKPEDHTREYDRTLAMLAMSLDNIIELSASEFQQLVQDEWGWKNEWTAVNSKYLSK